MRIQFILYQIFYQVYFLCLFILIFSIFHRNHIKIKSVKKFLLIGRVFFLFFLPVFLQILFLPNRFINQPFNLIFSSSSFLLVSFPAKISRHLKISLIMFFTSCLFLLFYRNQFFLFKQLSFIIIGFIKGSYNLLNLFLLNIFFFLL